jgi:oxygen-independent coproporphyrinogen-3 oxidase
MLPADLLDRLLGGIFARLPSSGEHLHCVEASPDSITTAHLEVLKHHGVGRVSMGTQSLHDDQLGDVNRLHSAQQTLEACRLVIDSGLVLNIDLMYGLPGQTHASFRRDFMTLAELGVPSMTVYDLRLNERTPVARNLKEGERLELEQLLRWRQFVVGTLAHLQTHGHPGRASSTGPAP